MRSQQETSMTKDNVVKFPVPLAPALLGLERQILDKAAGRDIDRAGLRAIIERVQPIYEALSQPLDITVPDTPEDIAAAERIKEPLRHALVKRMNEVIWAQIKVEMDRL